MSVSAAYQPAVLKFDNKVTFTDFVEAGSRTTTYKTVRGAGFDFGGGVEIYHDLFVGAEASRFNGSADAEIDEQVPHPFFFNQPRTLKGTSTALPRDEIALHIQVGSLATFGKHLQVMIAFGPSVFKLKETFVTDITYTQEYPYDTVTFQSARTEQQEKSRVGGNAQANIIVMMNKHIGVDGLIRYSHTMVSFAASDGSTFKVPAGGMHVGIGLRAAF